MAIGAEGNVKWVDGIRGIASALVVIKHLAAAWFNYVLWPAPSAEEPPILMQWPYLRVLIQGRIGVATFCFVTGYVCALKPVKLFVQGNQNQAYASMTRSAIRRVPRLVLPVSMIVFAACIACQLGAYDVANNCDGYGLPETSPNKRDTLIEAFWAMLRDQVRVYSHGKSEYGSELWTMMPILKGAFWIYCYLVATARVQQRYRMIIALALYFFRWSANDPFFGMQFFFGAFMADLQNLDAGTFVKLQELSNLPYLRPTLSVFLVVTGLYIGSLPDANYEWQSWSLNLHAFLESILPEKPDFPRFASGLALNIIVVGLHLSPAAREVLSNRFFLFLGRMSFAVYLLHNQILRSILCWMVYGFTLPKEGEPRLPLGNPFKIFMLTPLYLGMTYGAAWCWTTYVDAWAARVSERLVNLIKEDSGEKTGPTLLPSHSAGA